MDNTINEEQLKKEYSEMSDFMLIGEAKKILGIPNARTNIEALTKMTLLMPEFESRGIEIPQAGHKAPRVYEEKEDSSSGAAIGTAILGVVLIVASIGISAATGRFFYGLLIGGVILLGKSLINIKL